MQTRARTPMAGLSSRNTECMLIRQLILGGKANRSQYILLKEFMNGFNFCVKLKLGPELLLFQIFDGKIKTINYG